jgi:hypothetical protein
MSDFEDDFLVEYDDDEHEGAGLWSDAEVPDYSDEFPDDELQSYVSSEDGELAYPLFQQIETFAQCDFFFWLVNGFVSSAFRQLRTVWCPFVCDQLAQGELFTVLSVEDSHTSKIEGIGK